MRRVVTWIDRMNSTVGLLVSYLILITSFILLYEIIGRYFFNAPTIWAHDISTYIFGIYSVYGGVYAMQRNAHVGVDIVVRTFSGRTKAIFDLAGTLVFLIFLLILIRYLGDQMWVSVMRLENSRTAFSIPVWPLKIITFFGVLLFVLQCAAKLMRDLHFVFTGREMV